MIETSLLEHSEKNTFYIFSGLPGAGKSTLSKSFAAYIGAAYFSIDTIEQGFRDLCQIEVEGEGYGLAYRIVSDNLLLGLSVVADSCNPIPLTRYEWEQVAISAGVNFINIEIQCSDPEEHRARVENRLTLSSSNNLPSWEQVTQREYVHWDRERIAIDTAGCSSEESFEKLLSAISHH